MTESIQTSPAITSEIQKLAPSAVIELFVLDLSIFGQGPVRFHAGTNALLQRVVWQGHAYEAFPIQVEGFEFNGGGQVPRPRLRVFNAASGGIMLDRVVFPVVNKGADDSLTAVFTFTMS